MERYLQSILGSNSFEGVPSKRSATMGAIRGKGNRTTELRFRMGLIRTGISGWIVQEKSLPGKPDFFFRESGVAVFIDGCFWHGCSKCGHIPATRSNFWASKFERNRRRDNRNGRLLRNRGITVVRFWEHELKSPAGLEKAVRLVRDRIGE